MKTFSVITVNRNHASGLARTRDSILEQTGASDAEWIVVDGASTDDSMAVALAGLSGIDGNATSHPDNGIYDAMNQGWRRAQGDLVIFLNSGDTFSDRDVLKRVADYRNKGEWRWGYGAIRRLDASGKPVSSKAFAPFSLDKLALGLDTVPHQATVMEAELLDELGGFDESFAVCADQELMLRAAIRTPPAVWIDFLADFEPGGVGSTRPPTAHAKDMRRASVKNGYQAMGGATADRIASLLVQSMHWGLYAQARVRRSLMR